MDKDFAETIGFQAVSYVLKDEKRLDHLMRETGLGMQDFKNLEQNPETLAGVLDFLLSYEDLLMDFCEQFDLSPEIPIKVRRHFPGFGEEFQTP
ncbi:DUF3572 family protein [Sneathiella sp. P13V-1]|uniref:DUF3572 domain-containing protein n=1 Tax=Sneathiella sp. P13V-1 TaxID=2697366 RepID=UPI00187B39D3|nr:DUF3572 domain-containing protein [Sneathiella sp. P13V-1]MBE7636869.1 DUF3572 family protein [Sneathiella sp. P13V-1]